MSLYFMITITDRNMSRIYRSLYEQHGVSVAFRTVGRGTGIAFIVPVSSFGGKKPLRYLTEHQNFEIREESALKDTKYELLVVIANQGYSNLIMDAAREADAGGGTVIHAQGTGMQRAEQFLGVSLVNEKEILFIVVRTESKNRVMRAIMNQAGLESKARSIVFSLPVTATAGMRLLEDEPEEPA